MLIFTSRVWVRLLLAIGALFIIIVAAICITKFAHPAEDNVDHEENRTIGYSRSKEQVRASVQRKQNLKNRLIKCGRTGKDIDNIFQLTQLAKKALQHSEHSDEEPSDTGVWSNDIILNGDQAQYLIESFAQNHSTKIDNPPDRLKRGVGLDFKTFPLEKWTLPIPFSIDSEFSEKAASDIRSAMTVIASNSCISFEEYKNRSWISKDYIFITVLDSGEGIGCGSASNLGKQAGATVVGIVPVCPTFSTVRLALHGLMHALGFYHEHQRYDRDDFLNMQDPYPGYLDNAVRADPHLFDSYGTRYDYESIMHYSPCLVWSSLPCDHGTYSNKIGNTSKLSRGDFEILNRAYCAPAGCEDQHRNCGWWASMYDFCRRTDGSSKKCKRSCGLC